jgi:hypothetical protein
MARHGASSKAEFVLILRAERAKCGLPECLYHEEV